MIKRTGFTVAMLLLLPLSLPAQRPDHADQRIDAARKRVVSVGIPAALIDSRIAEGRAKGVPEARIAAAVEHRAEALLRAREALSRARNVSAADISAGADAVEKGVPGSAIQTIAAKAREEDRPVALAVLGYLHAQEIPVGEALARVEEALASGPAALANLPAQASAARERRGPAAAAGNRPAHAGNPGGAQGGGTPAGVPAGGNAPGRGKPSGTPGGGKRP